MISIVIPIYNVAQYLDSCVQSVVNQSYRELEIILVDDGSTDTCGILCDKWVKKDHRIKVIHKKNGGLSSARNAGIEAAKGEYISFIDSDDMIHRDMLADLYECITADMETQIAGCSYLEVKDEKEIPEYLEKKPCIKMTGKDAVLLMLDSKECFNVVAWNKLYKKKLFDNIRYPEGYNHEDMYITPKLLYESEQVTYIPNNYYFHRYNPESIIHSKYSLKSQDEILGVEAMRDYLQSVNFSEAVDYVNRIYLWKIINHIGKTKYLLNLQDKNEIEDKLVKKFKKTYIQCRKSVNCRTKERLQFELCYKAVNVYMFLRRNKYKQTG